MLMLTTTVRALSSWKALGRVYGIIKDTEISFLPASGNIRIWCMSVSIDMKERCGVRRRSRRARIGHVDVILWIRGPVR